MVNVLHIRAAANRPKTTSDRGRRLRDLAIVVGSNEIDFRLATDSKSVHWVRVLGLASRTS